MNDQTPLDTPVVDAIVGRESSWIVRSGITLVFGVVLLLLLLSWFIQYPDTLSGTITLTTAHPPAQLVAKSSGRITHIFANEGEHVTKGSPLVLLENSVHYDSLTRLQAGIKQQHYPRLVSDVWQGIGELQPFFNSVVQGYQRLSAFDSSSQLNEKISGNKQLASEYLKLTQQYRKKIETMHKKLALEKELLANNVKLKAHGLVTAIDVVRIENSYLDKQMSLRDQQVQAELYEIKSKELSYQNAALVIQHKEEQQKLTMAFSASLQALKTAIETWKYQYQLSAPVDGVVSFADFWSINQQVNGGDVVVSIVDNSEAKIGRLLIQQFGVGEVQQGQKVNIELDSFPAKEFGMLQGYVKNISLVPGQKGYILEIFLPPLLETSYGTALPFIPNATGKAVVITNQRRLIERFFDKVLQAF